MREREGGGGERDRYTERDGGGTGRERQRQSGEKHC